MSRVREFLREKGFYFALLGCILAAALSSVWAIRNMIGRMSRQDGDLLREGTEWSLEEDTHAVTNEVRDLPITSAPQPSAAPKSASQQGSGSSGLREPSALQGEPLADAVPSETSADLLPWPVNGEMGQGFSGDELVYSETLRDWRTHNGVDIACQAGSAVRACTAGQVTAIYDDGLFGTVAEVIDGARLWRYCGLDAETAVNTGDAVEPGQLLGRLGTVQAESSAGAHLHLEVEENGCFLDPAGLMG